MKKMTTAAKIRRMLAKGYEPKEIARRLDCTVQQVYTERYKETRRMGIGTLVTEEPKAIPVVGVATPRKRGRPRKVQPQQDSSSQEERVEVEVASTAPVPVVIQTKPSMVQRVKEWFASWR